MLTYSNITFHMSSLRVLVLLNLTTAGVILLEQTDRYAEKPEVCWVDNHKTRDANFQQLFQKQREKVGSNAWKETLHWAGTQHSAMNKIWVISSL